MKQNLMSEMWTEGNKNNMTTIDDDFLQGIRKPDWNQALASGEITTKDLLYLKQLYSIRATIKDLVLAIQEQNKLIKEP